MFRGLRSGGDGVVSREEHGSGTMYAKRGRNVVCLLFRSSRIFPERRHCSDSTIHRTPERSSCGHGYEELILKNAREQNRFRGRGFNTEIATLLRAQQTHPLAGNFGS